jgi:diguanylate cyclase (GGDEF)-like protein/PAS domain S-box-containing protein
VSEQAVPSQGPNDPAAGPHARDRDGGRALARMGRPPREPLARARWLLLAFGLCLLAVTAVATLALDHESWWLRGPALALLGGAWAWGCLQILGALRRRLAFGRLALTQELRTSEARFRSLVQRAFDVVTVAGADGVVRYTSGSVERVLGYGDRQLLGMPLASLVHPDDRELLPAFLHEVTAAPGRTASIEWRVRHRDGSWLEVETVATNLLHLPEVGGIVLNTRSLSERKALERELARRASHDPLTGLLSRPLLRRRIGLALDRAVRSGYACALLLLDLDGFKVINDSLGHLSGDQVLVAVAALLRECLRPNDTAARLGGDEFAVLLEVDGGETTAAARAVGVAERVCQALQAPVSVEGAPVTVSASIGIRVAAPGPSAGAADAPGAGGEGERAGPEELLRDAETAMYFAKTHGGGAWQVFDEPMRTAVLARRDVEADLRQAVDNQVFTLRYQPVIDLASGHVAGFEALVRWRHPERGLVMPEEFIAIAEEIGVIVPLGRWALETACQALRDWQERFPSEPRRWVAVNLSVRQLQQPDLLDDVAAALASAGLDAGDLVLELTETVFADDAEEIVARLAALRQLGVHVAIDDFGTGYSSLGYLRRLPVDTLKVAKPFVDGLRRGAAEAALVRAIVRLGSTLQLRVIAEGVEEARQAAELAALGCGFAQGFHFGRPLDVPAVDARLEADREPTS